MASGGSGARRVVAAVPLLAASYIMMALANLLLGVCVGRVLGAASLGVFTLGVATARIFFAATDLGMNAHLGRAVAREPERAEALASLFVAFRMVSIPLAVMVAVAGALLFDHDDIGAASLLAVTLGLVSIQALYEKLLLSKHRQWTAAVLTGLTALHVTVGCLLWYAFGHTLLQFAAIYLLATASGLGLWIYWTGSRLRIWPKIRSRSARLLPELRQSWQTGASVLLGIAALRIPIFVLGLYGSTEDVGTFSAADMFVNAAALLQVAVSNATFPRLAASFHTDPARFRAVFWASNGVLAAFGLVTALGLALWGVPVISIVFPGKDFSRIQDVLPILAFSAPALLLAHHNILVFAAADHQQLNLKLMAGWFVIMAGFQVALVPAHIEVGAAWGVLLGRVTGVVLLAGAIVFASIHRGGGTQRR